MKLIKKDFVAGLSKFSLNDRMHATESSKKYNGMECVNV